MTPEEACRVLGVMPPDPRGLPIAQATTLLEDWKTGPLADAWRAAVATHHPDRGISPEDTAARTAKTAQINNARDVLRKLVVRAPRPEPVRIVFTACAWGGASSATTSSTTWGRW